MNSNLRAQLIPAAAAALMVYASHMPLQRKVVILQRQVAQLQTQVLAEASAAPANTVVAQAPVRQPSPEALNAWMGQQRARAWQTYPFHQAQSSDRNSPVEPMEIAQVAEPVMDDGELLSDEELGHVVAGSDFSDTRVFEEPRQIASAPQAPQDSPLQELTEEELDTVVAGAGAPPPGPLATPTTTPSAPVQTESVVNRSLRKVEKGGVLLPKGRWQVEPSVSYSHVSRNKVALSGFSVFDVVFIGEIRSDAIERDIVTPAVNLRYGLTNNLQTELKLPLQFQREEATSGPIENPSQETATRFGLTDLEGGVFYQFAHETATMPNMIANLKLKAPTGHAPTLSSGSWGAKAGLIMVKSSDPVALFSNMAYSVNFPATVNSAESNPGNSFEYSLGMAYALNYNLALNAGFEQIFIGESMLNGSSVVGSRLTVANLKAGITWSLSKQLALDFSIASGLTEDSPDLSLTVSVPYTF